MTQPTQAQIKAAENTDRELWREREGDYYADSIHVTKDGGIGMNVGGSVVVMPIRKWFALTAAAQVGEPEYEYIDGQPVAVVTGPEKEECNATIERCAQVVEQMTVTTEFWRDDIAAVIRKLKAAP